MNLWKQGMGNVHIVIMLLSVTWVSF